MAATNGTQNTVQLGKETTFNTPVTPTLGIPAKFGSAGLVIDMQHKYVGAIKGTPAKNKCVFNGNAKYSGSFDSDFYTAFTSHILRSALGSNSVTTVETGVYKHTFTENVVKPSYSVQQKYGSIIKRFSGFVVSKFGIDVKTGEAVGFKFEGMGAAQATQSDVSPTYETLCPLNFGHVTSLTIGGTDYTTYTREITVDYDNGLAPFYPVGSTDPAVFVSNNSSVTGKLLLRLDTVTADIFVQHLAATAQEVILLIEGQSIGTTSKNTLKITIPKVDFKTAVTKLDNDINLVDVSYEALDDTSYGQIKIEVTNTVATL